MKKVFHISNILGVHRKIRVVIGGGIGQFADRVARTKGLFVKGEG